MQTKKQSSGAVSGILLPMGLICLFAFCSLALALFGGQAYKQIQQGVNDGFGSTVAASYLRTKLSQSGDASLIELTDMDGVPVLCILSADGSSQTYIYMENGQLTENVSSADGSFSTIGGIRIAQVARCDFTLENGLFTAEIESESGSITRAVLGLPSGGVL